MKAVLLADFGSTFTKLTAVDIETRRILGTAQSFTTAHSDILLGYDQALGLLKQKVGSLHYDAQLACSSAAGGLKMIASGLVPELTAKAARYAAFGAGAKVQKTYAYMLTGEDADEIADLQPDILLLTGGIDGGNREVILHNAEVISRIQSDFPVIIAGNRCAQEECERILQSSPHPSYKAKNVMPELNKPDFEDARQKIREVFLQRIILCKGLKQAQDRMDMPLVPTPTAVLEALSLLAKGTSQQNGIGELVAVDLGGATTDVYSIAQGNPTLAQTLLRGLREPFVKRTVEGDIGMRWSAAGVAEAVGLSEISALCGIDENEVRERLEDFKKNPSFLPNGDIKAERLDKAQASLAIRTALKRHAGRLEQFFTPMGPVFQQIGKDLSAVKRVILTGGTLIYLPDCMKTLHNALAQGDELSLLPKKAKAITDKRYILSAMGLLAQIDREAAMGILLEEFGEDANYVDYESEMG